MTTEQLNVINERLSELRDVYGYNWDENFSNLSEKAYVLKMDNFLTNYMKTYKVIKTSNNVFLEITLSSKYVEKKMTKERVVKKNTYELSSAQWIEIDNHFEATCFWVKELSFEVDTCHTDYLVYTLEGFDPNENACTKNTYHMTKLHSRKDKEIQQLLVLLTDVEPMDDLDELNNVDYRIKDE